MFTPSNFIEMNIVIIEDEKLTAKDLERTILSINSDCNVIATLYSKKEAVEFLETHFNVDLIFSDIQLGDGLSFEIFEEVNISTPIIYVTAFNTYALNAFKTFSIDYVLKPFTSATIANALNKFLEVKTVFKKEEKTDYSELISILKNQENVQKSASVLVKKADKIIPLKIDEIALFYTEFDTVFAVTFNNNKHTVSQTLNKLEKIHIPNFFRANRQFLIHRTAVKDVSQHFNRKLLVNLKFTFNEPIFVGKLKVTSFLDWLEKY